MAKPIADAVTLLREKFPSLVMVSPVSETIANDVIAAAGADLRLQEIIFLPEARKFDVFAAADAALACSGTVTTQLSCAGIPTVVTYRVSPLTYAIGKLLFKPDYISLVNIAADKPIMPEFIQGACTGENLAVAAAQFLDNPEVSQQTSRAQISQTDKMRGQGGSASARAAKTVLELLA